MRLDKFSILILIEAVICDCKKNAKLWNWNIVTPILNVYLGVWKAGMVDDTSMF